MATSRQPNIPAGWSNFYIGIDPGLSGGLANICSTGAEAAAMPKTDKDIWEWLSMLGGPDCFAVIEKVGGYAGTGHPGSAMFKFGASYGGLKMALTAAGIAFEEVTPQTWQKALGISTRDKGTRVKIKGGEGSQGFRYKGGESKTEFKNRLKAKAQQLFPGIIVTLSTADALLIAEYCRRKREGKL